MPNFEANLNDALELSKREDKIVMVIVEGVDEKNTSIMRDAVSELNLKKFPNLITAKVPQNSSHYSDFIELYGNLGTPCLAFIEKKGIPLKVINRISDPKIMFGCLQETARFCNEKVESRRLKESLGKKTIKPVEPPKKEEKPIIVESRILFRMPDNNSKSNTFKLDDTVLTLRNFVDTQIKPPFRYELLTYHPYKQLQNVTSTIRELELFPSAVLMIAPVQSKNSLSVVSGISNLFWFMVNPIWNIWTYIVNIFRPVRQNEQPEPVRRPPQPPVRRRTNVHTLRDSDDRKDDDDDENKTWNGNSTQQM